ncbi:glycosyltransferase family 87 protein [Cupriavidus necator]|uniref:glycosyltransferase family 87 protein n=1 Tax=Cupriavidus necator TaxID=106590 RepID=UPI0030131FF1
MVLLLFVLLMVTWACFSRGFTDSHVSRPGVDFAVFWSASYLALSEGPVHAYDLARHLEVMKAYGPLGADSGIVLPWLYPPTFLLLALPLALLPLPFSYLLFVAGSGYAYLRVIGRLLGAGPVTQGGLWLPVVAAPAVLISAVLGQNALLTAALAGGAVALLGKRPLLAGVLIGLLAIKPQLALLVPLALLAGRHWRTLLSAGVTAVLFVSASVAVCGWETIPAFLQSTAWARENLMEGTPQGWYGMPSVLAAAQLAGLSPAAAYVVQGLAALAAAGAVAYVWSHTREAPLRAAVLAAGALLATPYVRHYELTWMGIAVAGLVADGLRHGLSGREKLLFVAAWLLPVFEHANPLLGLPQVGPLVSALLMLNAVRRVRALQARPVAQAVGA